jgi:hypothetical protein
MADFHGRDRRAQAPLVRTGWVTRYANVSLFTNSIHASHPITPQRIRDNKDFEAFSPQWCATDSSMEGCWHRRRWCAPWQCAPCFVLVMVVGRGPSAQVRAEPGGCRANNHGLWCRHLPNHINPPQCSFFFFFTDVYPRPIHTRSVGETRSFVPTFIISLDIYVYRNLVTKIRSAMPR